MNYEVGGKISWTVGLRGRRFNWGLLGAVCGSDRSPAALDKDKGRGLQQGRGITPKSLTRPGAIWQKAALQDKRGQAQHEAVTGPCSAESQPHAGPHQQECGQGSEEPSIPFCPGSCEAASAELPPASASTAQNAVRVPR